jgi:hypothetical protein
MEREGHQQRFEGGRSSMDNIDLKQCRIHKNAIGKKCFGHTLEFKNW